MKVITHPSKAVLLFRGKKKKGAVVELSTTALLLVAIARMKYNIFLG